MTSRPAVDVSSVQIGTIKLDVCGWMDDALPLEGNCDGRMYDDDDSALLRDNDGCTEGTL